MHKKLKQEEEAARIAKAEAEIQAALAADVPRPFTLGMRVADEDGNKATVRYIGPVKSAKNSSTEYIGVEWDDSERGKHDGSLEAKDGSGTREVYFRTASPKSGSFVKPAKLNRGVAFATALYNSDGRDPTSAVLKGMNVSQPGNARLQPLEEPIRFLNLEDNLLVSLENAFEIAARCPHLLVLRMGLNRFDFSQNHAVTLATLSHLHSLTLTVCNLRTWTVVEMIAVALPALQELSLSGNKQLGKLGDTDGADGNGCMLAATPDENGEEPFVKACLLKWGFLQFLNNAQIRTNTKRGFQNSNKCRNIGFLHTIQKTMYMDSGHLY